MTWAPTEAQKSFYTVLVNDPTLQTLLGQLVEGQQIQFSGEPDSGDFKLRFGSNLTAAIPGSADMAADIQSALRLIEGLELVTVTLTAADRYRVNFVGLIGDQPVLLVEESTLEDFIGDAITEVITTLVVGTQKIFDHIPDNEPWPYVHMNFDPWTERSNETWRGWETDFETSTWYRAPGRGKAGVQAIQKRIDELIHHTQPCIEGWNIVALTAVDVSVEVDVDNVTLNGLQRFKLLIGEN